MQAPSASTPLSRLLPRGLLGGTLMGLANLVPGISGGTMLLASGIYPRFVEAVADVTTLKLRRESLLLLGTVVSAALFAIVLLAGTIKSFVVDHRWIAYSIFIGLTLGGVPVVWGLIRTSRAVVWISGAAGFCAMVVLALWQSQAQAAAGGGEAGFGLLFLAGVVGASAMILPGISGGYMLLVLGVYVTILGGIDDVKQAASARDFAALVDPTLEIVLPVGLGVLVGVIVVANAIKWLLAKYELPTLGTLLGLLVGAVVGLWPFQRAVAPMPGDVIKGRVMTAESIAALAPADWPNAYFAPTLLQIVAALGLVALGFAATHLVARLGHE